MAAVTPGVVMPCVPRAPVTNMMCLLAMPMCESHPITAIR